MRERELQLARFGEFLLRRSLASERTAPHMVRWVRGFLTHPPVGPDATLEERVLACRERLQHHAPARPLDALLGKAGQDRSGSAVARSMAGIEARFLRRGAG